MIYSGKKALWAIEAFFFPLKAYTFIPIVRQKKYLGEP
jgi:hypothetical protein